MPKKSNKTEQVLRLIAKGSEKEEGIKEEPIVEELGKEETVVETPEEPVLEEPKETLEKPAPKNESVETDDSQASGLKKAREFTPREEQKKVHRISAPVERDKDIRIANLSELLVEELMYDVMKKLNVCDCSLCKADIMALTLNHVPQKYVTTEEGKQFMQLNMYRKQYETDIMSSLTRACVRVKGSPRHN